MFCAAYYGIWAYLLPSLGKYQHRHETLELDDGAIAHRIVKVSNDQLKEWDSSHDAVGRVVAANDADLSDEQNGVVERSAYTVEQKV